ncbi:MAG: hypothetical protein ACM3X4_01960 [Ignavibacteriales bacterium]
MRCFDEQELDAYLDGVEVPGLPEHVRDCRRCAGLLRQMECLRSALREAGMETPPQDLAPRVMYALGGVRLGIGERVLYLVWLASSVAAGYILSAVMLQRANALVVGLMANAAYATAVMRLIRGISSGGWTTVWLVLGIPQAALIWVAVLLVLSGIVLAAGGSRRFAS